MDDDDDDAHRHPFHQLHHLYTDELQGAEGEEDEEDEEEGEEENDDDDGEDEDELEGEEELEDEDGDEEDDEEEHEDDEEDALDDDEIEDEDDGDQEQQDYEQDFELEQRDNRAGNNSMVNGTAGPNSAALTLFQPDGITTASVKIEGSGDKHSVRDDWTEAATHALLGAWGDRYVQLNKGNLKQEDWEEVAEVVSASSKTHKTDVQCKNRVDTLKKKYKVEKHKQSAIGSTDSKWPFYKELDNLLSGTTKRAGIPGAVDAGQPVKSTLDREQFNPGQKYEDEDIKAPNNASTSSKSKESPDVTFISPHVLDTDGTQSSRKRKFMETPFKTLAKAITKFGEIYEKMEQSKQQQLMDLEKTRMEFTRDLELQRMQLFMQTQIEIAKMKHSSNDIDATVSNLSG